MPTHDNDSTFTERFIVEYLKDLHGANAARRAGSTAKHPEQVAYKILQRPEVQEKIAAANAERMRVTKIEANDVLREVHAIAMADHNEIVEVRRGCCRHCHGIEHRYQYVTERELNKARDRFLDTHESLVEEFEHGGLGFDPKRDPHGECPQCGGEGNAYVHANDTRKLSSAARALYAGAKQTKDGIEVKLHDKGKHLELLMRHMGLLKDKVEITGNLAERILAARKRVRGR